MASNPAMPERSEPQRILPTDEIKTVVRDVPEGTEFKTTRTRIDTSIDVLPTKNPVTQTRILERGVGNNTLFQIGSRGLEAIGVVGEGYEFIKWIVNQPLFTDRVQDGGIIIGGVVFIGVGEYLTRKLRGSRRFLSDRLQTIEEKAGVRD